MKAKSRNISINFIVQLFLITVMILQILPIFWLLISSFKPSVDIYNRAFSLPTSLYLENYDFNALATKGITIFTYLKNSIIVVTGSLILTIIFSFPAGYAIAKLRLPGKNIFILIFAIMIGIPIHILLIPIYYFFSKIGITNNYFGLILPFAAFEGAGSILLIQAYLRGFPDELIEAAKIDGCSEIRAFLSIVLPLSMGAISTVLVVNFIVIWNEFLFAFVIMRTNHMRTLPIGITLFQGQYEIDWGSMFAALNVIILPSIIFYSIFHRYIAKGLIIGALKE